MSPTRIGSWPNTPDVFGVLPRLESLQPLQIPPLPTPLAPQPPRFPSFNELLSQPEPEVQRRREGLFSTIIRNPAILYREYLEHPDMFQEETAHLLTKLVGRQKSLDSLSEEELKKLDEAVVSFLQYRPKKKIETQSSHSTPRDETDDDSEVVWGPDGPLVNGTSLELPEDVAHNWWGQ